MFLILFLYCNSSFTRILTLAQLWTANTCIHLIHIINFCYLFRFFALQNRKVPVNLRKKKVVGPPGQIALNINASQPQSAFSVLLGKYSSTSEKIIHFHHIIYNEQNHYSAQTGMFTCVIPGVYQFSFVCMSYSSAKSMDLWCNNNVVLHSYPFHQGGRLMASGDTVLQLEVGDKVWVESKAGISGLSTKSYFSGHMVFAV
uniref:C1q domain-containing protein n=1 Tax=Labrus bergylta TaxID=56723 RepID=A0A3Q3GAA2_9LABR